MSKAGLTRETINLMEGIARGLKEGLTVQQIAIRANLDTPTVDGIIARAEFHEVFKELDPAAYESWQRDQQDLTAKRAVRTMARADAVEIYQMLKNLVTTSTSMKDSEKATHLFNLLKIGGVLDKGIDDEPPVRLSEGTAELFRETLTELYDFFQRKPGS